MVKVDFNPAQSGKEVDPTKNPKRTGLLAMSAILTVAVLFGIWQFGKRLGNWGVVKVDQNLPKTGNNDGESGWGEIP